MESKPLDFLQLYLSSKHYDCTFLVGKSNTTSKIFKCHKLVLQAASEVFESMLYGKFSEATCGPDAEIKIDNVSPAAFDVAMRFIYGEKDVDFENGKFACEVYLFANQWHIESLVQPLKNYIQALKLDWICQVYEMFKFLNDDVRQHDLLKKMQNNTMEVLQSQSWLEAKEGTVLDILQCQELSVHKEKSLFEALVRWGRYKILHNSEDYDDATLRGVINKGLRLVRFKTMSCKEFAELSRQNDIFSNDEKLALLTCIILDMEDLIPIGFSKDGIRKMLYRDCKDCTCFSWDHWEHSTSTCDKASRYLEFSSTKNYKFMGVNLYCLRKANLGKSVSVNCTLKIKGSSNVLSTGVYDGKIDDDCQENFLKFEPFVPLEPGTKYKLTLSYATGDKINTAVFSAAVDNFTDKSVTLLNINGGGSVIDIYGLVFL